LRLHRVGHARRGTRSRTTTVGRPNPARAEGPVAASLPGLPGIQPFNTRARFGSVRARCLGVPWLRDQP
jgi:hypothetical protein